MTLAELETKLLSRLEQNSEFFPTYTTTRLINQALRVVNLRTGFFQETRVCSPLTVPGRSIYRFPYGLIAPLSVVLDKVTLRKTTLKDIGGSDDRWIQRSSTRSGATSTWAAIGQYQFAIYPACDVPARQLWVTGVYCVPKLVNPSDVVDLSDYMVDQVVDHAQVMACFDEGGKVLVDAIKVLNEWQKKVAATRGAVKIANPYFDVEAQMKE